MNTRTAWIVYTLLRLAFFAIPFALILFLLTAGGFSQILSAIIAAVVAALIAVSLSVIFLSKQRAVASTSIYEWRNRSRTADDVAEDAALDHTPQPDAPGATLDDRAADPEAEAR